MGLIFFSNENSPVIVKGMFSECTVNVREKKNTKIFFFFFLQRKEYKQHFSSSSESVEVNSK